MIPFEWSLSRSVPDAWCQLRVGFESENIAPFVKSEDQVILRIRSCFVSYHGLAGAIAGYVVEIQPGKTGCGHSGHAFENPKI